MKKKEITTMKKSYKIEVDCANCANKMEEAAKNTAGVKAQNESRIRRRPGSGQRYERSPQELQES